MTPVEREYLRLALLQVLDANQTRFGLGARALASLAREFGLAPSPAEAEAELLYLEDLGLVCLTPKRVSPENRAWRLAAAGRDYLAERGL